MPDNLRITTPINNTEGIHPSAPANDTSRTAPVNPSRVPRPNGSENSGSPADSLPLDRTSVYSQFIKQLEQAPGLERTLQKLLSDAITAEGPLVRQITAESLPSAPLHALVAAMAAQGDDILKSLTQQEQDATLFTGPFFKFLGQISSQSSDAQFDLRLADFLKAYTGYAISSSITQAIRTELTDLKDTIPAPFAKRLSAIMEKLSDGTRRDLLGSDLLVLKKKVIPLLSEYVSKTNDYGKSRDTISMLLNNTAILNESSKDNLSEKFSQLLLYSRKTLGLPNMAIQMLQSLFTQVIASRKEEKSDRFLSALISLLSHATEKDLPHGIDRATLNDITHSLLLDSSVFMPFYHLVLPAQIDGRFLFAQIWVEKQDPEKSRRPVSGEDDVPKSIYLTFEIQNLGYFEASVHLTGKQVDMSLSCPPALDWNRSQIRSDLAEIFKKDGLTSGNIRLSTCEKPKMSQIILQKIAERKRTVDVTV